MKFAFWLIGQPQSAVQVEITATTGNNDASKQQPFSPKGPVRHYCASRASPGGQSRWTKWETGPTELTGRPLACVRLDVKSASAACDSQLPPQRIDSLHCSSPVREASSGGRWRAVPKT